MCVNICSVSGNQYDRLIQQNFLEAAVLDLATAVGRKVSILLRGEHKEQVQSATKNSQTGLSSTYTLIQFAKFSAKILLMAKLLQNKKGQKNFGYPKKKPHHRKSHFKDSNKDHLQF